MFWSYEKYTKLWLNYIGITDEFNDFSIDIFGKCKKSTR